MPVHEDAWEVPIAIIESWVKDEFSNYGYVSQMADNEKRGAKPVMDAFLRENNMEYGGLDNTQRWMRIVRHIVESEQKFADPSHYKSLPWMKFYADPRFWKYHIIGSFLQFWMNILKIILFCLLLKFSNIENIVCVFIAFLVAQFCSCLSYLRLSYFSQFVCCHLVCLVLLKMLYQSVVYLYAVGTIEGWVTEGRYASATAMCFHDPRAV
jgi:hypothetical protein